MEEGEEDQDPLSAERLCIKTMAESAVSSDLPNDILTILAEDASYRLRRVVTGALQYIKHARRHNLTTTDVSREIESSFSSRIMGHSNASAPTYSQIEAKKNNKQLLFYIPEPEVDLEKVVATSQSFEPQSLPRVKLTWGAIAGAACPPCYFSLPRSEAPVHTPMPAISVIHEDLIAYYNAVTDAILGDDEPAIKLALSDLQKNAHISPLLPKLVDFVKVSIEELSHDAYQLTKLLQVIRAIFMSPHLFIENKSHLTLVQCVLSCVVKEFPMSIKTKQNYWTLRKLAAQLLVEIHRDWLPLGNKFYHTLLRKLESIFKDLQQPLDCHYGAVIGIMAFGVEEMETYLYPHMSSYMEHLNTILRDNPFENTFLNVIARDIYKLLMVVATEILLPYINKTFMKSEIKDSNALSNHQPQATYAFNVAGASNCHSRKPDGNSDGTCNSLQDNTKTKYVEMYKKCYTYFGEPFRNSLPMIPIDNILYVPSKKEGMHIFSLPTDKEINLMNLCPVDLLGAQQSPERLSVEKSASERLSSERSSLEGLSLEKSLSEKSSSGRSSSERMSVDERSSSDMSSDDAQDYGHFDEDENLDYRKYGDFHLKKGVTNPTSGIDMPKGSKKKPASDERDDYFHGNDRSVHNLGSCDDLQVSELVSDPTSGVKLVITKRSKESQKTQANKQTN